MNNALQDVRYGLRSLRKAPGFALIAILTLGLGIGANTAIFSVIESVMLRPLPYADSSRLVLLADADNREAGGFLQRDVAAFQAQSRSYEGLAFYFRDSGFSRATLNAADEPEQAQGAWVSANLFPLLRVAPRLGRAFTAEEQANGERVVVLSEGLWRRHFGAAADALGKTLTINGAPFLVIGVMPEEFQFPARDQIFWAPVTANQNWNDPALAARGGPDRARYFYERWQMVGRLRNGVTLEQAQAEGATVLDRIAKTDPDAFRMRALHLTALRAEVSGNTRLALLVLLGAVGCILLIACANVANLVLARGAGREREMAIRRALGARRRRLIGQMLTEGMLLGVAAGGVGIALAWGCMRALVAAAPGNIPRMEQTGINAAVLAFTSLLTLLAAVGFSLWPALFATRAGPEALGTRAGSASRGLRRTHNALVVGEFALAVTLVIGAGLLLRSFLTVEAVDPGFEPQHVLALRMTEPKTAMHQQVLQELKAMPQVKYAGAISDLFEVAEPNLLGLRAIEGRTMERPEQWTSLVWKSVNGDYFQAIGARLVRGRTFSVDDTAGSPRVAVIDESMARRYWLGQDPVGARIKGQDKRGPNDDWITIIGVVGDMHSSGLEYGTLPHVFEWQPQAGVPPSEDLVVRATGDTRTLEAALRNMVRRTDPNAILSSVSTVEGLLWEQLAPRRFQTWLLGLFSALALLLASIGIYGVMQFSVTQRTHDMGVRLALGARPWDVLRMVEKEGLRLALAGCVLGAGGAWLLTPLIANLLFGVRATDPLTFALVVGALVAVAMLASYVPAQRAASVDPMVALRQE